MDFNWTDLIKVAIPAVASAYSVKQAGKAAESQINAANKGAKAIASANKANAEAVAPYMQSGIDANRQISALLGLSGAPGQQMAYDAILASPEYNTLLGQGQNALLSNASATGGLRGGNTQRAFMEYAPTLLNTLVNERIAKLSGLTDAGLRASGSQAAGNLSSAGAVADQIAQAGAARAGKLLAAPNALNNFLQSAGNYLSYKGF